MAISTKIAILLDVPPCSLVAVYQRFAAACYLHNRGRSLTDNWPGIADCWFCWCTQLTESRNFISIITNKYTFSLGRVLTFWHRSFTFNSNKSPTWCHNFSVYYPDVCLQLNMCRAFSRASSGAQWLQWQLLVLPSYHGDSRAVFVVGPVMSTAVTTIRR